ncbi:MAG: phosphoesterase, partial [Epsilonproteobacteria bacterium]|nr:phosphoesterase [Campylobacterota bacterium]
MNKILEKINSAKHIVIFSDITHLPVASALYSHLLRLDKKLSFVLKTSSIPLELSFLPWYDKIKTSKITSYDFLIEVDFNSFEFFEYLKDSNNKINKKIATSLYAGILKESVI